MRILYVSDAPSIHTRRWVEHFRDKGADVHVASFRPFSIEGVTVHVLQSFGLGKFGYFFAPLLLRRLFKELRPDIVHAQYVTSYGFFSAVAKLRPLIVTAWGTDVLITPKASKVMRTFARYAIKRADVVTTVAEHMNASVVQLGIPHSRVEAIPFGVDVELFRPPELEPRTGPLKLICTRNFGPIYDVETLIKAVAKIHSGGHELTVDLVGDGPLRQALYDKVKDLNLSNVRFLGHVSQERLSYLLAHADIFVTPALSDGNNVSLNEAMACGCFPIATDIPANKQWIADGVNGYLYPRGDANQLAHAIGKAISNTELRKSSKNRNLEIVRERADWRHCVARMESIYERLSGKQIVNSKTL